MKKPGLRLILFAGLHFFESRLEATLRIRMSRFSRLSPLTVSVVYKCVLTVKNELPLSGELSRLAETAG